MSLEQSSIFMTGGSKGFSRLLWDCLPRQKKSFCRATGYDLKRDEDIVKMAQESLNCDIFINYTHVDFQQTELLYQVFANWKQKGKKGLIVNIGSFATYEVKPEVKLWVASKYSLDVANQQCCKEAIGEKLPFRVCLLKLGFLSAPENQDKPHWDGRGHSPEQIIEALQLVFQSSQAIDEIVIRPS
ncbi:MAG: hypothetical protein KDD33_04860 [Bdellovibrionales bacterium]|nr:hypothetical protein [Bdellovibrionales bacterium]